QRGRPGRRIRLTVRRTAEIVVRLAISPFRDEGRQRPSLAMRSPAPRRCQVRPQVGVDVARCAVRSPSRPDSEVQAVRLLSGLTLVGLCLALAGCGLTQRSRGTTTRGSGGAQQPFMGAPEARDTGTASNGG